MGQNFGVKERKRVSERDRESFYGFLLSTPLPSFPPSPAVFNPLLTHLEKRREKREIFLSDFFLTLLAFPTIFQTAHNPRFSSTLLLHPPPSPPQHTHAPAPPQFSFILFCCHDGRFRISSLKLNPSSLWLCAPSPSPRHTSAPPSSASRLFPEPQPRVVFLCAEKNSRSNGEEP